MRTKYFTAHTFSQPKINERQEECPEIDIVIPNYNNEEYIMEAIQSVAVQRGIKSNIVIYDNNSTDRSWELILKAVATRPNISAMRLPFNTGPHIPVECLLKGARTEYVMLASGNDILFDFDVVHRLYKTLENNQGFCLAYGRNIREGKFSEPLEYAFSTAPIVDVNRSELMYTSFLDCTSLYTSGEPLWGLYRSTAIKHIPIVHGYASDHAFISCVSTSGGIIGCNFPARIVSPETRTSESLRNSQIQDIYSNGNGSSSIRRPSNELNFLSMIRTYRDSILRMPNLASQRGRLIKQTIRIIGYRFNSLMRLELSLYPQLFAKASAQADKEDWIGAQELKDDYRLYQYVNKLLSVQT